MTAILSQMGSAFRETVKLVIKGGVVVTNAVSEFAAAAGGEFHDLVSEARAEVNARHAARMSEAHAAKIDHPKVEQVEKGESEGLYGYWVKAEHAVVEAEHAVVDVATKLAAAANAALIAMVAWCVGESKEKASEQVDKGEEFVEHLAKEITTEESINVIETLLIAA